MMRHSIQRIRDVLKRLFEFIMKYSLKYNLWVGLAIWAIATTGYSIYHQTSYVPPDVQQAIWVMAIVAVLLLYCEEQRYRSLAPPPEMSAERQEAAYPPPPEAWLKEAPEEGDIILGRWQDKYVSVSLDLDEHWTLLGSSGKGKTSCFVGPVVAMNENTSMFITDPKGGELYHEYVGSGPGTNNVRIFNPKDRGTWGYDMLYSLTPSSTLQDVFDVITPIVETMCELNPKSNADPVWVNLAQGYLIGTLAFAIHNRGCRTIIDAIDWTASRDAKDLVEEILAESPEGSLIRLRLHNFEHMGGDTLYSVLSQVDTATSPFASEHLRYALRDNPNKISPLDLDNRKRVICAIDINDAVSYRLLLRIMIGQMIRQMFKRETWHLEDYPPALILCEELPVLLQGGAIKSLLLAAKELRGYKCRLFGVVQTLESMLGAYTEDEVMDYLSNTNIICLDGGKSMKTMQMIADLHKKFYEKEWSYSRNGGRNSSSLRYNEKPVITPYEINHLGDECIILTNQYGSLRIKKAHWSTIPSLAQKITELRERNHTIADVKKLAATSPAEEETNSIKQLPGT